MGLEKRERKPLEVLERVALELQRHPLSQDRSEVGLAIAGEQRQDRRACESRRHHSEELEVPLGQHPVDDHDAAQRYEELQCAGGSPAKHYEGSPAAVMAEPAEEPESGPEVTGP